MTINMSLYQPEPRVWYNQNHGSIEMRLLGCRRYVRNTAISKDLAQRRAELESEGYVVRPLQPPSPLSHHTWLI